MNLHDLMKAEYKRVDMLLSKASKAVSAAPDGKLMAHKNGNYWRYRVERGGQIRSLKADETELKELLAIKAFNENLAENLADEKKAIGKFLKYCCKKSLTGAEYLSDNPGIALLLQHRYKNVNERVSEWESAKYSSHAGHPENLRFMSMKGHPVRSKSEMLYANQLYMSGIPYRYECDMRLDDGTTVCPDFLVLNPNTGVIIPHEHFGMFDREDYRKANTEKLNSYIRNGFYPGLNFIVTYETNDRVFDSQQIQEVIDDFWKMSAVRLPWHKLSLKNTLSEASPKC